MGVTFLKDLDILKILVIHTVMEPCMFTERKQTQQRRQEMAGIERLGLRVSMMINHPVAQIRRWVTIHRLDTETDRDWEEVMGLLSETDGIDLKFHDDGSVTLRWEPNVEDDRRMQMVERASEISPF